MATSKLQTAAQITSHRAARSMAAGEIDPKLFARVSDGTVSKRDIAEATQNLKDAKADARMVSRDTSKAGELEHERAIDRAVNHANLLEAIVDQYRKQPGWQSMLEDIKDGAAKWGTQFKQEFMQGLADPGAVLKNIR